MTQNPPETLNDLTEQVEGTNTLPVPVEERAALALQSSKTEQDISALVTQLKTVTVVNSPAGRDQAHALTMKATRTRTTVEKAGKAAREDATKFSKAVIAEEKRLIALIEPEETRVKALRDAWDQAEAERKEAEAKKERDRIAAHQGVIEQIKGYPSLAAQARTSEMVQQLLGRLQAVDVSGLEEFAEAAELAKIKAVEQVENILADKQAAEAEAARAKAEQEAEAARLVAEREKLERQQAEAKRQADELAAQQKAMADQLAAQQAELDRQRAELAAQQAAIEAAKAPPPAPEPTPVEVEADAPAVQPPATEVAQPEPQATPMVVHKGEILPAASVSRVERPTDEELVDVISMHYGVAPATAHGWLSDYDANAVIHRLAQAA